MGTQSKTKSQQDCLTLPPLFNAWVESPFRRRVTHADSDVMFALLYIANKAWFRKILDVSKAELRERANVHQATLMKALEHLAEFKLIHFGPSEVHSENRLKIVLNYDYLLNQPDESPAQGETDDAPAGAGYGAPSPEMRSSDALNASDAPDSPDTSATSSEPSQTVDAPDAPTASHDAGQNCGQAARPLAGNCGQAARPILHNRKAAPRLTSGGSITSTIKETTPARGRRSSSRFSPALRRLIQLDEAFKEMCRRWARPSSESVVWFMRKKNLDFLPADAKMMNRLAYLCATVLHWSDADSVPLALACLERDFETFATLETKTSGAATVAPASSPEGAQEGPSRLVETMESPSGVPVAEPSAETLLASPSAFSEWLKPRQFLPVELLLNEVEKVAPELAVTHRMRRSEKREVLRELKGRFCLHGG